MKLASVRDLKAELKDPPRMPAIFASALAVRAGPRALTARLDSVHTRTAEANEVALGVAPGRGRNDFRLGVRIQVAGARAHKLANDFEKKVGKEADIRIVPRVRKRVPGPAWFQGLHRPLEAGLSVGHYEVTAGTIGFIVEDDEAYYVLSNNHVLADVNNGKPGDPVLQPGKIDRKPSDETLIGVLDRFVPISFRRSNVVDCAVAELLHDIQFYEGWTEALPGLVRGVEPVTKDDLQRTVFKAGRTTGVTEGTITQIEVDRLRVDMGDSDRPKLALFSDQFEIQGKDGKLFSDGGDSGSLIVNEDRRAMGLLFAGGPDESGIDVTFANRIELVLKKLGVTLAT